MDYALAIKIKYEDGLINKKRNKVSNQRPTRAYQGILLRQIEKVDEEN